MELRTIYCIYYNGGHIKMVQQVLGSNQRNKRIFFYEHLLLSVMDKVDNID